MPHLHQVAIRLFDLDGSRARSQRQDFKCLDRQQAVLPSRCQSPRRPLHRIITPPFITNPITPPKVTVPKRAKPSTLLLQKTTHPSTQIPSLTGAPWPPISQPNPPPPILSITKPSLPSSNLHPPPPSSGPSRSSSPPHTEPNPQNLTNHPAEDPHHQPPERTPKPKLQIKVQTYLICFEYFEQY